MGTVPSSAGPAANGTTTEMIAVAAHSAARTEACANSLGCSGPLRWCEGTGSGTATLSILPGIGAESLQRTV